MSLLESPAVTVTASNPPGQFFVVVKAFFFGITLKKKKAPEQNLTKQAEYLLVSSFLTYSLNFNFTLSFHPFNLEIMASAVKPAP
jgi:hypothetical protein